MLNSQNVFQMPMDLSFVQEHKKGVPLRVSEDGGYARTDFMHLKMKTIPSSDCWAVCCCCWQ